MKGRKQKMEEYIQKYNKWLADPVIDEKSKKELKAIEERRRNKRKIL